MLCVFELLVCVLEMFQLLSIAMMNLIAPCRDDGRDGYDAVDFDCLSCLSATRHLVLHCSFAVLDVVQLRVSFVGGFLCSADARGV
jgi:hypothetical protein